MRIKKKKNRNTETHQSKPQELESFPMATHTQKSTDSSSRVEKQKKINKFNCHLSLQHPFDGNHQKSCHKTKHSTTATTQEPEKAKTQKSIK